MKLDGFLGQISCILLCFDCRLLSCDRVIFLSFLPSHFHFSLRIGQSTAARLLSVLWLNERINPCNWPTTVLDSNSVHLHPEEVTRLITVFAHGDDGWFEPIPSFPHSAHPFPSQFLPLPIPIPSWTPSQLWIRLTSTVIRYYFIYYFDSVPGRTSIEDVWSGYEENPAEEIALNSRTRSCSGSSRLRPCSRRVGAVATEWTRKMAAVNPTPIEGISPSLLVT